MVDKDLERLKQVVKLKYTPKLLGVMSGRISGKIMRKRQKELGLNGPLAGLREQSYHRLRERLIKERNVKKV